MSLFAYRSLVKQLVLKDLKLKYRDSALGFLWSLANPLLMIVVYTIAFKHILRSEIPNYAFFLLVGLLPWNFFAQALLASSTSVIDHSSLIRKLPFAVEVFPVSSVLFCFFQFAMALAVLVPAGLLIMGTAPSPSFLLFPVLVALQVAFIGGLALLLSTATVYFRDMRHIVEISVTMLFWLTPVLYDFQLVPPAIRGLMLLNPMTIFVIGYQDILFRGIWPSPSLLLAAAACAAGSLLLGGRTFGRFKPRFAEIA